MDVPRDCVAKRTRHQLQKGEEGLPNKARILKEEKDKGKRIVEIIPRKPIPVRSSKDDGDESSGDDIQFLGDQHLIAVTEQTQVKSLQHDSEAANQNQGTDKHIGALSRPQDGIIYIGSYPLKGKRNQGRRMDIGNSSLRSEEDNGSKSDQSDSQGDENQNRGGNVETSDATACESSPESSGEEDDKKSDDDYNDVGGGKEKDHGITSSVKRNPVGKKVEYEENEGSFKKRTMKDKSEDDDRRST